MRFINTNDIEAWANLVECKYHLPHLVRKLILATTDNLAIKNLNFPYGEDVQTGGYDGELSSDAENMFVPLGESVWEFGTTNNKKGKADEDYSKRKLDPLDKIPDETTYININAKKYRDKGKWAKEKNKEGFWKDVRYIDAIDIEQWLELAPSVELWLAEILKKPTLGIYTPDAYWKIWSEGATFKIVPDILLGESRKDQIENVKTFFKSTDSKLYIKSVTTDEAVAFPLAILMLTDEISRENVVVIDNIESFNRFSKASQPLIIIAKFKIENIDLREAMQSGHKIIIPISLAGEAYSTKIIELPIVSRISFEDSLEKMGIDSEQARLLTSNSGRNISVLKRILGIDSDTKPQYLDSVDIRDLIPILLINRFDENYAEDNAIIEKLSGKSSEEYIQFLRILYTLEDAPIYYISGTWRLVSPNDSWLYLAKYITKTDLEKYSAICLEVLCEISYKYTVPLEERGNIYSTKENRPKYSNTLKEGLCESLLAISVFGNDYGLNCIANSSQFVDRIVEDILQKDLLIWRSLSGKLTLLAEASPSVFLNNLERIIKDRSVTGFFELEKSFHSYSNDLPDILFCLDIIAWFPECIMRVSKVLCELIILSPDSLPTTNTPFNNLKNIFRIWYPQTNTNLEDRKKILSILVQKYPDALYSLLYSLIGSLHDTAFNTPRPKWRLFSELRQIQVSRNEVYYMRGFCFDLILEISKNNLNRILGLIELLDDIYWDKIDEALSVIETGLGFSEEDRNKIFHIFRKLLCQHRSYPTADWSLPTEILDRIEKTALNFISDNHLLNDIYLFEEHYPDFIEGRDDTDFEEIDKKILSKRLKFIDQIIDEFGIGKIFELAHQIDHPSLYGNILAQSTNLKDKDKLEIYKLIESEDKYLLGLVGEFISISELKTNLGTQIDILDSLIVSDLSNNGIVNFLSSLKNSITLFKYVTKLKNKEVEQFFWKNKRGFLFSADKKELFYALKKLLKYKKSLVYLNTLSCACYQHKLTLTSEEVLDALEQVPLFGFEDDTRFDHNHFNRLLDLLYSRSDYDIARAANIEMKFMFVFSSSSPYSPKPKNLFALMAKKPTEYFGLLKQVYLPENEEERQAIMQLYDKNPNRMDMLRAGWNILNSFNKIPSLKEDGNIDSEILSKWIFEVRELAKENYTTKTADNCLGQLLAKYPINLKEEKGFPIEIYDVIEDIGTEEIIEGFRNQIFNNLGSTSRGAFDGGMIERYRAKFFDNLFEETKITHPLVAEIFRVLRNNYQMEATREDKNALLRSFE